MQTESQPLGKKGFGLADVTTFSESRRFGTLEFPFRDVVVTLHIVTQTCVWGSCARVWWLGTVGQSCVPWEGPTLEQGEGGGFWAALKT